MKKKTSLLIASLMLTVMSVQVEARVFRGPLDQQGNFVFEEGPIQEQYARFNVPNDGERVPANQAEAKDTVVKMREDDEGTTVLFDKTPESHYLKKKVDITK